MKTENSVTLSSFIELCDISTDGRFEYESVIDLRRCEKGNSRPIEEVILKKLRNHFISYKQLNINIDILGSDEEAQICEVIEHSNGNSLVITDDVPKVAHLCNLNQIPFVSKVFYVVETGKGDIIKPFDQHAAAERKPEVRFGASS